jgi:hypothetical protein
MTRVSFFFETASKYSLNEYWYNKNNQQKYASHREHWQV